MIAKKKILIIKYKNYKINIIHKYNNKESNYNMKIGN